MLDRMTRGLYKSTPHRVQNQAASDRLSFPFFFDPNFDVEVKPIELTTLEVVDDDKNQRWDQTSVHDFRGTYGEYVLNKISKFFHSCVTLFYKNCVVIYFQATKKATEPTIRIS